MKVARTNFQASSISEEWKVDWAKRHADNMQSCNCWMCKNPRKVFHQLSFDQIKQKDKERHMATDLDDAIYS